MMSKILFLGTFCCLMLEGFSMIHSNAKQMQPDVLTYITFCNKTVDGIKRISRSEAFSSAEESVKYVDIAKEQIERLLQFEQCTDVEHMRMKESLAELCLNVFSMFCLDKEYRENIQKMESAIDRFNEKYEKFRKKRRRLRDKGCSEPITPPNSK